MTARLSLKLSAAQEQAVENAGAALAADPSMEVLRDLARKVAEEERERAVRAVEQLATQASEPPTFTEIFDAIRGAR